MAHDLLLTAYRSTQESAELSESFEERRAPDRDRFNR
jgi:naphthoate synthase